MKHFILLRTIFMALSSVGVCLSEPSMMIRGRGDRRLMQQRTSEALATQQPTEADDTIIEDDSRDDFDYDLNSTILDEIEARRRSSQPTIPPSYAPSRAPSSTPSDSVMPSDLPSEQPSLSMMPSHSPSSRPSYSPSVSNQPSSIPSAAPTVSFQPSKSMVPSSSPSVAPSASPSAAPTMSSPPSSTPSISPTSKPSAKPSDFPSDQPSYLPTGVPSRQPSMAPSTEPSGSPSSTPSVHPSENPTTTPSSSPSVLPSSSPTLECHDHVDYRSPINDLTCEDHRGTPCVQWRLLGLNTTGLGQLLKQCPETCEIPCGSFAQFDIPISYQLSGIPGILDSDSKRHLEEITMDFSTTYVKARAGGSVFDLDRVELISQNSVDAVTRVRRLKEERLLVTCRFEGFRIGIDMERVIDLLVAGVDSSVFEDTLRASGDPFFVNAVISSASEIVETDSNAALDEEGNNSSAATAAIVVSTLVCVSVCSLGIWAVFFRNNRNIRFWRPSFKLPPLTNANDTSVPGSPAIGMGISRNADSMISFDNSEARTAPTSAPGLLRLITSLSLSRSKSSTEPEDSDSPKSEIGRDPTNNLISPMSGESGESESIFEEHPLSNVIPPMMIIDIDHIDSDEEDTEASPPKRKRDHQVVPSKRVEASSALLAAISGSKQDQAMQSYDGVWYPSEIPQNETEQDIVDVDSESTGNVNRARSPLGIIVDNESDDDDTSVASTPIYSAHANSPIAFRRSMSSSALDSIDRSVKHEQPLTPSNLLLPSPDRGGSRIESEDEWSLPSPAEIDNVTFDISFGQLNPGFFQGGNPKQLPPIHPSTPTNGRKNAPNSPRCDAPKGRSSSMMWSLSPITKVIKENTPKIPRRSSLPLLRKKSSTDTSQHSETTPTKNEYGSVASLAIEEEKPIRFEFEAPRKGQLGLVIEANKISGPVVHGVKDYSPLFGLVKKGDRLVQIDGRKIMKKSTLTELMRLLAVRPGRRASTMRIVVERENDMMKATSKNSELEDSDDRNTSFGSSSRGSLPGGGGFEFTGFGSQRAEF